MSTRTSQDFTAESNSLRIELVPNSESPYKRATNVEKSKSLNDFDDFNYRNAIFYDPFTVLNIRIIGKSGVGKTALINRFVINKFIDKHFFTWKTISTKEMTIQGTFPTFLQ